MRFVIDTSILIDALRGGDKWEEFLKGLSQGVELYIPTIVIFELFSGLSTKDAQVRRRIQDMVIYLQRIELTEKIAIYAGELYRDISLKLEVPDYVIAASALDIGAEVVTLNEKHFQQIPNLKLYDLSY